MKTIHRLYSLLAAATLLAAGCGRGAPGRAAVTPVPTIDAKTRQLRVFDAAWQAVNDKYVRSDFGGVDWTALGQDYRGRVEGGVSDDEFNALLSEMLSQLPEKQAVYETRGQRLEEETADRRTYHGIGAFIAYRGAPEPHVVILAVIEDSPAAKAGLKPHDNIYAVDGQPFTEADAEVPAERIRGEPDSDVTLTVQSPGQSKRDVTIHREQIYAADVLRGGFLESIGVAYYRVPVAAESTLAQNIGQSLANIGQSGKINGVILDLRVARSGDGSWPLTQMLSLFATGDLGEFYTRTATDTLSIEGRDLLGSQTVPLVILIGPDTAGSPEVFAAALKSSGRATLLGMATTGQVEGFSEVPLPDGSRMFLATSSFRTNASLDLATTGLTPDVEVTADWGDIASDSDPAIEAALALLATRSR